MYDLLQSLTILYLTCLVFSQVPGIPRTSRTDATATALDGSTVEIKGGDNVWISMTDLNMNPEIWANPETIDINRKSNRYTLFSVGMHNCLGSKNVNIAQPVMIREVIHIIFQIRRKIETDCSRPGHEIEESSTSSRQGWNSVSVVVPVLESVYMTDSVVMGTSNRFEMDIHGTKAHMYLNPNSEPFPFPTSMTVMYEA